MINRSIYVKAIDAFVSEEPILICMYKKLSLQPYHVIVHKP